MEREYLANTILAVLVTLSVWGLWSVGEKRLDAYIAIITLDYTIVKALLSPRRTPFDMLFPILLAAFTAAIAYRIASILGLC
ncbi:MAG TPA: hypothetical protein EYH08_00505 [Pyrodictium sp.]|nr:hypothetical protein [Pyrodictium sp.]